VYVAVRTSSNPTEHSPQAGVICVARLDSLGEPSSQATELPASTGQYLSAEEVNGELFLAFNTFRRDPPEMRIMQVSPSPSDQIQGVWETSKTALSGSFGFVGSDLAFLWMTADGDVLLWCNAKTYTFNYQRRLCRMIVIRGIDWMGACCGDDKCRWSFVEVTSARTPVFGAFELKGGLYLLGFASDSLVHLVRRDTSAYYEEVYERARVSSGR